MTPFDFVAFEPQFADHLAPIYLALPPSERGAFIAHRTVRQRLAQWGIQPSDAMMPGRPVVVASYGDHKRVRRFGYRRIARAEHGAGQSYHGDPRFGANGSYPGGRDCHDVGLFLAPNAQSAGRWANAYPGAQVEIVGCPKLDSLPDRVPGPGPVVCVSFHFDINLIPETRSAWPTYRHVLPALAGRFEVIAHAHPKGIGLLHRYFLRMGLEVVQDFADVCRRADVYVCDNSSTLFEFASTGRPVVVLNDPRFRRNIDHGGRFWDWADVGLQCDRPADLIATVERALTEDHTARREVVLDQVYAYRTGAAERAAAALMAWAEDRVEVAA